MTNGRPYAVFSCDLDPVDRHLQGYGFEDMAPCDLIYRTAVPRLLDLFDELGVPGVLFVVARDARAQRDLLRRAVESGHEIASHSLTHPQPFRTLDDDRLRAETATARARLVEVTGAKVLGFRAPAWDVDARVLSAIRAAGYAYDASIFPTPALLGSRLAAYRRSDHKGSIFSMSIIGHAFASTRPDRGEARQGLAEFPIAVTPWLRFPVYHTMTHLVPDWLFGRALRRMIRSRLPICYEFHAADLLDLVDDRPDPRMERHPGMRIPLEKKRRALRDTLAAIAQSHRVVTYQQALDEVA